MKRKLAQMAVVGALLAGSTGASWGQSVEADVPDPGSRGGVYARGSYGHRFDSDLKDTANGEFSSDDARLELGGTADFGSVRWVNAFGYGYAKYDAQVVDADLHSYMLASVFDFDVAKSCHMTVGPVVTMAGENDADWSHAINYGGLIATTYRASKELSVGLAAVAMRRIGGGVSITPVVNVNWQFARNWHLYTGLTEVAARRGIGGNLGWAFAKGWEASVGMQFERRRFRLEDDDAIGEDRAAPVYARLSWEPITGLAFDATAGAAFGGRVELDGSGDGDRNASKYDPAPLVGLRVRYALSGL